MAAAAPPLVARSVANHAVKARISTQHQAQRTANRVAASNTIQKQKTRTSGTQARQRVRAAGQIAQQKQQISAAGKAQQYQVRQAQKAQEAAAKSKAQRKSNVISAATDIGTAPFKPQESYSLRGGPNPLMLIIFTMAGVIILYAMITTPASTSGFFDSMRTWVRLIYTSEPMFTTQEPTK